MGMNVSSGPSARSRGVTPNMNVTPLVDVVLVLLIIFMVVTPMLTKQFWLNLPKKDTTEDTPPPPPDADGPVVLTVEAGGVIRINKQVVERAELKDKLLRIFAKRKDQILFFDAKDDVPYGVAAQVMDLARTGGARTISILTEKVD
jgi:biopolymer transport protein TolR